MQNLSDDEFKNVIDAFNGNLVIADGRDPTNPLIYASAGYCELCDYSKEEVLGRNPAFLQGPNTSEKHKQAFRSLIKNKRAGNVTILNYKKNGEEFWNEVSLCPIFGSDGEVDYWVASHRDVTHDSATKKTYLDQLNDVKKI